jgi:hypothetical protein
MLVYMHLPTLNYIDCCVHEAQTCMLCSPFPTTAVAKCFEQMFIEYMNVESIFMYLAVNQRLFLKCSVRVGISTNSDLFLTLSGCQNGSSY